MNQSMKDPVMILDSWCLVEVISIHLGASKARVFRFLEKGQIQVHRVSKLLKFKFSRMEILGTSDEVGDFLKN